MRLTLNPSPGVPAAPDSLRAVEPQDVPALAALMLDAYRGTVDFEEDATLEDARAELQRLMQGEYGTPLLGASRVAVLNGRVVGAVLLTRWGPEAFPFVAFTMTAAAFKGQGIALGAMEAVIAGLSAAGEDCLQLVVTTANTPAVRLYKRLGFQVVPPETPTPETNPTAN
ncbi:GNAT family N-acetyltransferase [Deinococcus humi]|uniref:GNAT family N-acetyltransferase n=1 Tax=Deinococcus humi TaxID=662880 RepID=UPI00227CE62A|nr:GNAT family N-acetyltransferase [Deinococcus humi]